AVVASEGGGVRGAPGAAEGGLSGARSGALLQPAIKTAAAAALPLASSRRRLITRVWDVVSDQGERKWCMSARGAG
ncbi:MAG: hypothetical protein KGQ35_14275, partial [Burkholderiales bacterium]|nr:hypothetical protein [Burkholderiales bacterium]